MDVHTLGSLASRDTRYGRHARSAVGVAELARRIPVEINGEFELHP